MIMTEHTNETIQALRQNIRYFLKWTFISAISGVTIGLAGTLFGLGILKATAFWKSHSWTLYLLPLVGLLIVWLYRFAHEEKNRGTDMVLDSISSTEEVTPATAPLIFISTLLSHLATASVGREGAALQLGGSLGNLIGKAFRLKDCHYVRHECRVLRYLRNSACGSRVCHGGHQHWRYVLCGSGSMRFFGVCRCVSGKIPGSGSGAL